MNKDYCQKFACCLLMVKNEISKIYVAQYEMSSE